MKKRSMQCLAIAVCAVLWISNLVTGFVGTGVAGG